MRIHCSSGFNKSEMQLLSKLTAQQMYLEDAKNLPKQASDKSMWQYAQQNDGKNTIRRSPIKADSGDQNLKKTSDQKSATANNTSQLSDNGQSDKKAATSNQLTSPLQNLLAQQLQPHQQLHGFTDNIETPAFNSPSNIYYSIQNFLDAADRSKQ